jgi:hypothetical protein
MNVLDTEVRIYACSEMVIFGVVALDFTVFQLL